MNDLNVSFKILRLCVSCLFSQVCAEALLKTLELMSKLRQQVKDMETSFYRMLQVQTHKHLSLAVPHLKLSVVFSVTYFSL